jgi:hypothetical protein
MTEQNAQRRRSALLSEIHGSEAGGAGIRLQHPIARSGMRADARRCCRKNIVEIISVCNDYLSFYEGNILAEKERTRPAGREWQRDRSFHGQSAPPGGTEGG